jgi:hypothetical protein
LTLRPKTVAPEGTKVSTVVYVVNLEWGNDLPSLFNTLLQINQGRIDAMTGLAALEAAERKALAAAPVTEDVASAQEIVEEFDPDLVEAEVKSMNRNGNGNGSVAAPQPATAPQEVEVVSEVVRSAPEALEVPDDVPDMDAGPDPEQDAPAPEPEPPSAPPPSAPPPNPPPAATNPADPAKPPEPSPPPAAAPVNGKKPGRNLF